MARSLEGQEFLYSYNGGVNALVDRQTWLGLNKADQILKAIWQHDPGSKVAINYLPTVTTPIFTFANHKRVQTSPWFTGHTEHLEKLYDHIRRHGGKLCSEYGNFYVPFSNGSETGLHGKEEQIRELQYVTSRQQFFQTFGITLEELWAL